MKRSNFSENVSTATFSNFSTFSKFVSFYEESIWRDVIIIDESVFFQNHIFKDKKQNAIGIWPKLTMIC